MDKVFKEWDTEDGKLKFQERSRNTRAGPPWQHETTVNPRSTTPNLLGAQDTMEPLEMEEWSENGLENGIVKMETQNEQLLGGGDKLVRQNIQILDAQLEGMPVFPAKDIMEWVDGLVESHE